jgi:hypothetical protein
LFITRKATKNVELRIFEALAPLAGETVVAGSIQQLDPPAPDIECQTLNGPWAVELVAIDAGSTRNRLSNMFSADEAWNRALKARSTSEQAQLRVLCDCVALSVIFHESAGSRVQTRLMGEIQNRILAHPAGFSGELYDELELPPELHHARVTPIKVITNGPRIASSSAGYSLTPQVDKIRVKLTDKTYETNAPLELFAYMEHDDIDGSIVNHLRLVTQCIATHLPGSLFKRVSVFHLGQQRLVYRSP